MGPIFIGGLDRSGKTYLRFILLSGSGLAISRRTDLWPRFYRKFGDLGKADNLDRCLKAIASNKHIRSLNIDLPRLRLDFESGSRFYERLFALIHLQYAERAGKPRWGDQSELLEQHAEAILAAYPDARILHMLRDPRDRYEAVLRKSGRRGGVGVATARWLYSAALAEKYLEKYPGQYKVIRYEDMVREPEKTLRDICEFIGEPYSSEMLRMGNAPRFAKLQPADDDAALTPLSTEYIGQFRGKLSGFEIAFIQYFSRRLMQKFGYPLENGRFSLLGHLPNLALNAARLAGWHILYTGNG
jgi:hypothetical protein